MATRWGICSAGAISNDFIAALKSLPSSEHEVVCIAARDKGRAEDYAKKFSIPKSYGSYQELADDSNVEIVYIGSISTTHYDLSKMMLNAGKNVLCENSLTTSKRQSQQLVALARQKNLFFAQAIWSRFMPVYKKLREELAAGSIGDAMLATSNLCVDLIGMGLAYPRHQKKSLGAGAVLDLGIYTIAFSLLAFGEEMPQEIKACAHLNEEGADDNCSIILKFSKGRMAVCNCHVRVTADNDGMIYGTKGKIQVKSPFWTPTELVVNDKTFTFPHPESKFSVIYPRSEGLAYEAQTVRNCLLRGEKECAEMTHEFSLKLAEIMDDIFRQIGVNYEEP